LSKLENKYFRGCPHLCFGTGHRPGTRPLPRPAALRRYLVKRKNFVEDFFKKIENKYFWGCSHLCFGGPVGPGPSSRHPVIAEPAGLRRYLVKRKKFVDDLLSKNLKINIFGDAPIYVSGGPMGPAIVQDPAIAAASRPSVLFCEKKKLRR